MWGLGADYLNDQHSMYYLISVPCIGVPGLGCKFLTVKVTLEQQSLNFTSQLIAQVNCKNKTNGLMQLKSVLFKQL